MANSEFVEVLSSSAISDLRAANSELREMVTGVNNANAAFKGLKIPSETKAAITAINRILQGQNALLTQQIALQQQLAGATAASTQATQANTAANNAANTSRATSGQRTTEEIVNQRLLARNARDAAMANSTFASSYERLSAQQAIAGRRVQDLIARGRTATQTQRQYDAELRNAQREFTQLNTRVLAADRAIGRFNRNVGNYPMRAVMGLTSLLSAFGVVGGVAAIASITKGIYNTTKEVQSLDLALKQVLGSVTQFNTTQAFLANLADKYGIEINGLEKSYTQFYAAAKDKLSENEINGIFDSISKAAGAMGLSVEQQQGAFLALQQMISKGTIQAEELRGQLAERLPGAFGILAKSMGVTEIQLNKLLKDGKVLAADVLPAFAKELENAYGVETLQRVESLTAETTRLSNAWVDMVRSLNEGGGVLSKVLIGSIGLVKNLVEGFGELAKSAEQRAADQLKYNYNTAYQKEIDALKEWASENEKAAEDAKNFAKNEIADKHDQLKMYRQETAAIYEQIAALEKKNQAFKDSPANIGSFGNGQIEKQIRAENEKLVGVSGKYSVSEGQLQAYIDYLKSLDKVKPKDYNPVGTPKKQKQDIDYLKEIYNLQKQNAENQISDQERIMNDEEQNYVKRLEAANNYYFQKEALLKLEHDEQIRLNALEYKNQQETYEAAITAGTATTKQLDALKYQYQVKAKRIDENYEHEKSDLAIESAKKLQGVLEKIKLQGNKNVLSQQGLEDMRQAGLLLNGVSGETTVKQFTELENKMRALANAEEDRQVESLRYDLQDIQNQKSKINLLNAGAKENEAYNNFTEKELGLQKQILDIENKRKQSIADLHKEMKLATTDYLQSITQGFLGDLGLSSLSKAFDTVTYDIITKTSEGLEVISQKTGSTFEKMYDQAQTGMEKFQVVFTTVTELAQEAFAFLQQNQQKYYDAQFANARKEYELNLKFAGDGAAAKEELDKQYEERQREIRIRQAKAAKETALFNAIVNTAQAVVGALPNYVLAAAVAALGAVQIALISNQPIPAYALGTDNHPGGLARVGDGGRHEVIKYPGGKMAITPATDTLVNLPRGSQVYPDIASSGLLGSGLPSIPRDGNMDGVISALGQISGKLDGAASVNVTIDERGLQKYTSSARAKTDYHNNRVSFKGKVFR